ncbi:MAG: ADP-ribosylglycohydrolase family protein [Ruminococcus sp.]
MNIQDKIRGSMIGCAVGDALGMPYETAKRKSFDIYNDTNGGTIMPHYTRGMPAYWYADDLPPGVWTDDTAMTLAEAESIARLKRVDLDDIMRNFFRWNYDNEFTATGVALGQGRRTLAALERFKNGTPPLLCGGKNEEDNGNGSLMRMLPFVFCEGLMEDSGVTVADLSSLTHAHPISVKACEIYVDFGRRILRGEGKDSLVRSLVGIAPPFDRLSRLTELCENEIKSYGYVVSTLEASLWCFLKTDSYTDCVLKAVSLGEDTDTVAAIAGGLAGMYYGIDAIPNCLSDSLCQKELIGRITSDYISCLNDEEEFI